MRSLFRPAPSLCPSLLCHVCSTAMAYILLLPLVPNLSRTRALHPRAQRRLLPPLPPDPRSPAITLFHTPTHLQPHAPHTPHRVLTWPPCVRASSCHDASVRPHPCPSTSLRSATPGLPALLTPTWTISSGPPRAGGCGGLVCLLSLELLSAAGKRRRCSVLLVPLAAVLLTLSPSHPSPRGKHQCR